uniref:Uncharacterized protein n=1 Tax=Pinguiococcus pyrenoidosus TaxID=172671 RepID=A0A6U0VSY1_9STRA|mmetsp:Transcript_6142/g.23894  ORF Transcript_6142/g.23894 Transcript_6142/m.23894 type:complete len:184 (+) Transcript_6142:118-669(+)
MHRAAELRRLQDEAIKTRRLIDELSYSISKRERAAANKAQLYRQFRYFVLPHGPHYRFWQRLDFLMPPRAQCQKRRKREALAYSKAQKLAAERYGADLGRQTAFRILMHLVWLHQRQLKHHSKYFEWTEATGHIPTLVNVTTPLPVLQKLQIHLGKVRPHHHRHTLRRRGNPTRLASLRSALP